MVFATEDKHGGLLMIIDEDLFQPEPIDKSVVLYPGAHLVLEATSGYLGQFSEHLLAFFNNLIFRTILQEEFNQMVFFFLIEAPIKRHQFIDDGLKETLWRYKVLQCGPGARSGEGFGYLDEDVHSLQVGQV